MTDPMCWTSVSAQVQVSRYVTFVVFDKVLMKMLFSIGVNLNLQPFRKYE